MTDSRAEGPCAVPSEEEPGTLKRERSVNCTTMTVTRATAAVLAGLAMLGWMGPNGQPSMASGQVSPQPLGQDSLRSAGPLPVNVALNMRMFPSTLPFGIELSSDGEWVAYTLRENHRAESPYLGVASPSGVPLPSFIGGSDIWVSHTATGAARNVTNGRGTSYAPAWSPDGGRLAFYSDRDGVTRVWIWNRRTGAMQRASTAKIWAVSQPVSWTPDGSHIITAALPLGVTADDAWRLQQGSTPSTNDVRYEGSSVSVFRSLPPRANAAGLAADSMAIDRPDSLFPRMDLVSIDVANGTVQRLVSGRQVGSWWPSPDGQRMAFTILKGQHRLQELQDIAVVSFVDRQWRIVATDAPLASGALSWSPDGAALAYATNGYGARGDVILVPLTGGTPRNLTPAPHPYFGHQYRPPLWDPQGESIYAVGGGGVWRIPVAGGGPAELTSLPSVHVTGVVARSREGRLWSPHPHSLIAMTVDSLTLQAGFYSIDLATGRATVLEQEDASWDDALAASISGDGETVVFVRQDPRHSPDLWVVRAADFRSARRLTHANHELEQYALGESRLLEWRSTNGAVLRGTLILPSQYDSTKRYPLIVEQYPGDLGSAVVHRYGGMQFITAAANLQLFATRGYSVLVPDVPVTYGRPLLTDFGLAGRRSTTQMAMPTPLRDVADAVIPGVNKAIDVGIADPNRLGVMGCSYGAWSTVALIVQATRFRAAVAQSGGYYNSPSTYGTLNPDGTTTYTTTSELMYGGTLWERRDAYIENSPVFYLDRVETPLLITHGTRDPGPQPAGSAELFADLRSLGKEVEYARYADGGHCADLKYADQVDIVERTIDWFDSHLKN